MRLPLPQRAAIPVGPVPVTGVDFMPGNWTTAAGEVTTDMGDLAARVRSLMDLQQGAACSLGKCPLALTARQSMDEGGRKPPR
ncbi:hypothetical protein FNH09_13365 [Streptomyces adustus]|uniref:Uncharacterized protein n=1 Tax=Streptomyces adustus TaxID=1609272 RepID=A0A5N8VBE7_9ACTN|nr:hypothetical protein [Streptomyces adustus]MPY32236.1 hypothetical protein [Streptomyces adustus]